MSENLQSSSVSPFSAVGHSVKPPESNRRGGRDAFFRKPVSWEGESQETERALPLMPFLPMALLEARISGVPSPFATGEGLGDDGMDPRTGQRDGAGPDGDWEAWTPRSAIQR